MARLIAEYVPVKVVSRRKLKISDIPSGVSLVSMKDLADCDVIVLSNELAALEVDCKNIAAIVKPSTIVMDVCSVKVQPAQIMRSVLGKRCQLLATHPLFGPQSVSAGDAHGKNIVWDEVQGGPFNELETFFTDKLGLNIIKMSPDEHDKQMAWVHCLSFFVGRGLIGLDLPNSDLATNYYERLLSVAEMEKQHSNELFRTVQLGNAYSGQVRKAFIKQLQEIDEQLLDDHI